MSISSSTTRILPLGVETVGSSARTISDIHGLPLFAARLACRFRPGKFDLETGAAAGTGEHFNGTAVFLYDAVAHREPQACPFPCRFGGEKRIVDPVQMLLGDAVPGVDDLDPRRS